MRLLINERQFKKLLSEINLDDMDELIRYADYLQVMKTSKQKKLSSFLELIRTSGLVNMREAGQFLFMTKDHFDAMINFKKFERSFDKKELEILEQISNEIDDIRNLILSASLELTKNQKMELSDKNIKYNLRKIITTTLMSWMQGLLKK